jgi:hypothetical protein
MCKLPTQKFFTETFGLPLTMNPDFETLSCEMLFGVHPPPIEADAAYAQPCFAVCPSRPAAAGASGAAGAAAAALPCPKIDPERTARAAAAAAAGGGA